VVSGTVRENVRTPGDLRFAVFWTETPSGRVEAVFFRRGRILHLF
jgi:hypothetical protein